jgi:hypothetical protein
LEISIRKQIEDLGHMTVRELHEKYREVFGEESRSNHKQFLFRRIAWDPGAGRGRPFGARTPAGAGDRQ